MRALIKVCPLCGGVLEVLGKLGKKTWYRCRSCGMEFSEK